MRKTMEHRSEPAGPGNHAKDAVDKAPPIYKAIPLALQHVLIAYGGIITTPIVVGLAIGLKPDVLAALISANICVAGAATILQTLGVWKFGVRLPVVMGSTFTAIGPSIVLGKEYGLPAVFGATIVAGVVATAIAPFFGRLLKYFPPIVTGTVIAIIGISLLPTSANLIQGQKGSVGYNSMSSFLLAGITVAIVLVIDRFGRGTFKQLSILIALVVGTIIAIPMGKLDLSSVGDGPFIAVPMPFAFGAPQFILGAILPILIVQFVSMVETVGDVLAIGEIVGRKVGKKEVNRGLLADGAATAIGGIFTPFSLVTFANNVGLVQITKMFSRHVVAIAGGLFILVGLIGPLGGLAAAIPKPVLGGITVIMFGTIAGVGVKILGKADLTNSRNIYIIAISFAFGMIPVGAPNFWEGFPPLLQPVLSTGIAAGSISAFVLNLLLNVWGGKQRRGAAPGDDASAAPGSASVEPSETDAALMLDTDAPQPTENVSRTRRPGREPEAEPGT
ncbi:nucleobase:cation symporter-2 family protein [Humibacter antri]